MSIWQKAFSKNSNKNDKMNYELVIKYLNEWIQEEHEEIAKHLQNIEQFKQALKIANENNTAKENKRVRDKK
jgi:hypothetical protein